MTPLLLLVLFVAAAAVAIAAAGGRADSSQPATYRQSGESPMTADPLADPLLVKQIRYWHRLAVKRLRLLGARERRIVRLLMRLRSVDTGSRSTAVRSRQPDGVRGAICSVFGAHCSEALRVAWCESRFNVYATNGQYKGLFQMGSFARAKYGHSWNAWGQSRSAYRYFLDAGWSPWACRP